MATCRVLNATGREFSASHIAVKYQLENAEPGAFCFRTSGGKIAPDEWHEFSVPEESMGKKVDTSTACLELQQNGFQFENGQKTVTFNDVNNNEIRLELDSACPPFSEAEYLLALDCVRSGVEGAAPFPLPLGRARAFGADSESLRPFWSWVATVVGRSADQFEGVLKYFGDESCYVYRRVGAVNAVKNHPRRPTIKTSVSTEDVAKQLRSGKVRVEAYHRALERYPGGNADVIVACHVFEGGATDMEAICYRNWDGTGYAPDKIATCPGMTLGFQSAVLSRWADLVSAGGSQGCEQALSAGANGDPLDVTVTVIDDQRDSDEYDSEWTSIELLAFEVDDENNQTADDAPRQALARLHQHALYTGLYRNPDDASQARPATPSIQAVLDGLEEVVQMGRTEPFSEGETPAAQRFAAAQGAEMCWFGCVDPIYFAPSVLP